MNEESMMRFTLVVLLLAAAVGSANGCGDDDGTTSGTPGSDSGAGATVTTDAATAGVAEASDIAVLEEPQVVPLVTGLRSIWDSFPHRFSLYEMAFAPAEDPTAGGAVTVRNDGGPWGAVDATTFEVGIDVWRTTHLAAAFTSVELEIPPGSEDDGVMFRVRGKASVAAAALDGASERVALIRGWRLSTADYSEPPSFQSDAQLPYEPIDGFTTQGLGISLGEPTLVGDTVEVEVVARHSLGLSDREDMNAAIPQATSWIRVDMVVLGVFGSGAGVERGTTDYFIGSDDYGADTVYEHATAEAQRIELSGVPGSANALFGVTAFDLWLNVEARHDPSCVVIQDETNSWGQEISGPGRYVRELVVGIGETSYDRTSGAGVAQLDLLLTNTSIAKEVGNICLGAEGEVAMVQFDDPNAERLLKQVVTVRADSGETKEQAVTW